MLARDLRRYYLDKTEDYNGLTLGSPDAVHMATAIHYRADVFHTFDANNRTKSGTLGLLKLNGDVGGYNMTISRPRADQLNLGFED